MYPRIRDLREDKDLTQTQVAKMLGMSQTGYSKYETGENDIPTAVLMALAVVYMHRDNLKRLREGNERKISFGKKKKPAESDSNTEGKNR